jgi:hypothetical protein
MVLAISQPVETTDEVSAARFKRRWRDFVTPESAR